MNKLTLALTLLTDGCNSYGIISHEKPSPQKAFCLNEVDEFGRDCNELLANIRVDKKVVESLVYYTCAAAGPIKDLHDMTAHVRRKHMSTGKYDAYRGIIGCRTIRKDDDILSIPYISKINKKNHRR